MATLNSMTTLVSSTTLSTWMDEINKLQSNVTVLNNSKTETAFGKVKVGSATVEADALVDTVEFVGSNVTITPDATNDKVTFSVTSANVTSALGYSPLNSTDGIKNVVLSGTTLTVTSNNNSSSTYTTVDTKVTSVDNHYTPTSSTSKTATGGADTNITDLASGSGVQVLTGLDMDAAGHITGVKSIALRSVNTSVTAVANHYTPTSTTSKIAQSGTLTDIANSTAGIQVVTGLDMDAAGHITGVKSVALKATNTTYTNGTGLNLSGTEFSLKPASSSTIGGVSVATSANLTLTSTGALSLTSSNVVSALGYVPENSSSLATVAETGSYNDLSDKLVFSGTNGVTVSKTDATTSTPETYTISNAGVRSVASKSNGVVTVNTNGTSTDVTVYTLPGTTSSSLGGVIVGSNVVLTNGGTASATISVNSANTSTAGIMKLYTASGSATDGAMTQSAVTALVNDSIAAADAMIYKGTIGSSGCTITALPNTTAKTGWTYKVGVAGTYAGATCEVGDMIICLTDGSSTNDATWTIVQNNLVNAITGRGTSGFIAIYSGTHELGKLTDTIGSNGEPVYINSGVITSMSVVNSATVATKLGTANVGTASQGIYLASGVATAMTATIGTGTASTLTPTWMNAGVVTAASATIGGTAQPVYMNAGAVTALTATVGTGTASTLKPVWLNSGTITAASATIGGTTQPVYINSGIITAITTTIGSVGEPVYINSGVITSMSVVNSATKASSDSDGNAINTTYEKHIESATVVSASTLTVTKASARIQTVTIPSTSFTLSFTAASATEYSERYIHLTNSVASTTVTYTGGTWSFNGTAPAWGTTASKHLFIKATFVAGRVILDVLDNDDITLSADYLGSMSLNSLALQSTAK